MTTNQSDGTQGPTDPVGNSDGTGRDLAIADLELSVRGIDDGDESAAPLRRALMQLAESLEVTDVVPATWADDGAVVAVESDEDREDEPAETPEDDEPAEVETDSADEPVETPEAPAEPDVSERAKRSHKPRKRSAPEPRTEVRMRISDLQLRAGSGSGSEIVLEGTPIVYNSAYSVFDMFGEFKETMAPTVCDHVLASPMQLDCRYLFNHDGLPLARTQSGTLELNNSPQGLKSIAHLDSRQQLANDLAVAVERGDVSQMSCGFIVGSDSWNDDMTERTIYSFSELLDVSPVTYPASPTTSVSLAQRALFALPTESRARVREAFKVANELRAGKKINSANASLIMSAMEALHQADELDPDDVAERAADIASAHAQARDSLSQVSGLELDTSSESDGDVVTQNDPGDGIRADQSDEETRAAELAAEEGAELRRKRILAKRDQLARKRYY
jgi:HK97 family phage prohead protease